MAPRWESSFDASPRDAAMLAEVLGALQGQLTSADGEEPVSEEVQELITAAVAELHRVSPLGRLATGVAPVLGSGVVQELLRRRHDRRDVVTTAPERTIDERL